MSRLRAPFGAPKLQLVPEDGIPESPYPRCSFLLRGMARLADIGIAYALGLAAGRAGFVVALLYLLLADGIFHGQSVGKRIFGVKAVFLPMRTDARFGDVWAQTQVVDGKVVSGSQALARAPSVPVGPERWMTGNADRRTAPGGR
jgi:hypothetical protein